MSTITYTWVPDPMHYSRNMQTIAAALETSEIPLQAASEVMQEDILERFDTKTDPSGDPWEPWSPSYVATGIPEQNIDGILVQTGALREAASNSEAMVVSNDTLFYRTPLLPHYGLAHEEGMEPDLPQRSFLGMSDESAAVVFATFGEWFDGAISLYPTATGKVGMRHAIRGPKGFVPRSSVGKAPLPKL